MTSRQWKRKLKKACIGVNTYREEFEPIINTLADILESRDRAYEQFIESGSQVAMEYTNRGGQTNYVKNPLLVMWTELNQQALTFWRDLGLTPSGYRKLTEDGKIAPKERKLSLFDAISKAVE